MSIRLKVILPYLLLTLIVSIIGVYVVTTLVSTTMRERLTNQLVEAGQVVSDGFTKLERQQAEDARIVAFVAGLGEALRNEDSDTAYQLAETYVAGFHVEDLALISPQGNEVAHFSVNELGIVERVQENTGMAGSPLVLPFLGSRNPEALPLRLLASNARDGLTYYYTSIPVNLNGGFAGVVVVGTSVRTILSDLKSVALADVIVYGSDGKALGTTLGADDPNILQAISITSKEFQDIVVSGDVVRGVNISINGRLYSLARAPLQVGGAPIGVFAVALPLDFVVQSGENSRTLYVGLFTGLFFAVIVIGYFISRQMINPLYSLVNTSQAIAAGDLEQRTGIRAKDEIGVLAKTFDGMTENLQERTRELERMNQILKNIDKTKSNFIQISAHELRTPLTLIMGYSQMMEQDTRNDPELRSLAQGILDGSERMTSIVESMLDVSRIDSNALLLRKTGLRIDLLIKKVGKGFEKALAERNLDFQVHDLRNLPSIPADPDLLQKVFYHVIMNAIKFTPDGGHITIGGRFVNGDEQPRVEIFVRDTGIGINPDMHHLIFEKFSQTGDVLLHSSGKTKFKGGGPGLGLAIARGIVEAHGGRIWVESPGYDEETNPGSTFFISLPVEKQTEEAYEYSAP